MRLLLSVGEVVGWLTRGTQRGGDVGRHGLLHVECSVCIGTRRGATRRPLARDGASKPNACDAVRCGVSGARKPEDTTVPLYTRINMKHDSFLARDRIAHRCA